MPTPGSPIPDDPGQLLRTNTAAAPSSTDEFGEFEVDGIYPGRYYIYTTNVDGLINQVHDGRECNGFCRDVDEGVPLVVTAEEAYHVDFSLRSGGRISGAAFDESTLAGLKSGFVEVFDLAGNPRTWAFVDDGDYVTGTGLMDGDYFVTFVAPAYVGELFENRSCMSGICDPTAGTPVTVEKGATTGGIDFGVTPGGKVGGRVTAAGSGTSIATRVYVYSDDGTLVGGTWTDDEGEYVTPQGLVNGDYYVRTDR